MIPKKRFWTEVTVAPEGSSFAIHLDGKALKTPARAPLVLPNSELAALVAEEWAAVDGAPNPAEMPATRMANSAIDTVSFRKEDVTNMLADYAASDLLCYWAEGPDALIAEQQKIWQPVLEWVSEYFGLPVATTSGIMPVAQDPRLRAAMLDELNQLDSFQIAGLHDVIVLSGSAFLALAWKRGFLDADSVWQASRIDANWQISQWGEDEDEAKLTAKKAQDFLFATKFCNIAQI